MISAPIASICPNRDMPVPSACSQYSMIRMPQAAPRSIKSTMLSRLLFPFFFFEGSLRIFFLFIIFPVKRRTVPRSTSKYFLFMYEIYFYFTTDSRYNPALFEIERFKIYCSASHGSFEDSCFRSPQIFIKNLNTYSERHI